jgi:hypothetical protein
MQPLQQTLMNQEDLQAELATQPEIRHAFPAGRIDLNDTGVRQKVWQIMYGVYKRTSANPLEPLMTLMGKYLKAYTTTPRTTSATSAGTTSTRPSRRTSPDRSSGIAACTR